MCFVTRLFPADGVLLYHRLFRADIVPTKQTGLHPLKPNTYE